MIMSSLLNLKKLVPGSVENTIRTNRTDYPDCNTALRYVKSLLEQMSDKSHPTPMDADAVGQKEGEVSQDRQGQFLSEEEHKLDNEDLGNGGKGNGDDEGYGGEYYGELVWWTGIEAVGKGKGNKGKGKTGKGYVSQDFVSHADRICYNCGEKGHIAANCPKGKGKGKSNSYKGKGKGYGK